MDLEWGLYESVDPDNGEPKLGIVVTAMLADGSVIRNAARLHLDGYSQAVEIGKRQLRTWLEERTECLPLPDGIERIRLAGVGCT